jgi:hypothetical protein
MSASPLSVTVTVIKTLETLRISYAIGGSLASTLHGVVRNTLDTDIVADLRPEHAELLAAALSDAFYADVEQIRDAINRRRSFNLLHLDTMFKVDVFVAKPRAFDRAQLARRQLLALDETSTQQAYVVSAEDIVLAKLEWYRAGGEVSDRQWSDVRGVLKTQAGRLDQAYMRRMAAELDVSDLLERALAEAKS